MDEPLSGLGELELELEVMQLVRNNGEITAGQVRKELGRPAKGSIVRTLLHHLEEKGFATHSVDGRTLIVRAAEARQEVAAPAVIGSPGVRIRGPGTSATFAAPTSAPGTVER